MLWFLGEGMLGPLFSVFCERIGGNILDISWAWATYLITVGLLVVAVGKISDKVSKEWLLLSGFALCTIFTFGYLLVSKPWHLFLLQVGLGIAAALTIPPWDSLYAKYENKKKDGYTWGIAEGLNRVTTGMAIIIGGIIVTYWSFTALFLIMGVMQTIATLYVCKILKEVKHVRRRTHSNRRAVFKAA